MSWNYRILAHETEDDFYLQIHEVYYDENGIPDGYTEKPVNVGGDDIKEILRVIDKMKDCTEKSILFAGDEFPKEYKLK